MRHAILAPLIICSAIAFFSTTTAQNSKIVVDSIHAKRVSEAIDNSNLTVVMIRQDIAVLAETKTPEFKIKTNTYEDDITPVFELDTFDNTDFAVGILSHDTADGRASRDLYTIGSIEVNPIYPEGRYVDTMRATAGVDLSSEF